ncbi:MAG: sporulation protein YqfD [Bacillota bacterium]|jgi:similar to stage IV sporulation protein
MLLQRWQAFFRGHVIILVEGASPEKFINLALVRGILLWDVVPLAENRFLAKAAARDVRRLRTISRLSSSRFRIWKKIGLPFHWRRIRKRKVFLTGILVFILLLYFLSSFIWFVDFSSSEELEHLSREQILSLAADLGVKPGALKHSLDLRKVEKTMEIQLPELAWVTIEIEGTRALISVVEKELPGKQEWERKPGHIVASKDGVIQEILVISGQAQVREGDPVSRGQLLISGLITPSASGEGEKPDPNQLVQLVRARGIVRARVWYEATAQVALVETGVKATGKSVRVFQLKLDDRLITLKGPAKIPYAHYEKKEIFQKLPEWRNWQLPVELIKTTYYEVKPYRRELGEEEAKRMALEKALAGIREELPEGIKIVDRFFSTDSPEKGTVKVKVVVETLEEIGVYKPLT